jgi:hypothetical protein
MAERGLEADSLVTELDARLRAIQAELRPGVAVPTLRIRAMEAEPPPGGRRGRSGPLAALLGRSRAEPTADPAEPAQDDQRAGDEQREGDEQPRPHEPGTPELLEQVKAMTEVQTKLLAASERLIEAFVRMIESPPAPAQPTGLFTPTVPPPRRTEITAGPFADTEALREFERALAQVQGVRRVAIRGYEGSDHAVFDVELRPASDR